MRVLITGGAGFIGSHLADRLASEDYEIQIVDNFVTGKRNNILDHENVLEQSVAFPSFCLDFEQFRPEIVIHAAASYNDPDMWIRDTMTNTVGTIGVVRACQEYAVKYLIYFQTLLCYGLKYQENPISLSHPLEPAGSYAISKTAGEQYIRHSGLNFISFRMANIYGPRNLSGPIPTFYHRLTNNLHCYVADTRRDFIYISDLIDLVMGAIESQRAGIYHVSSSKDYSIKDVYQSITRILDIHREPEVRERGADDAPSILLNAENTYRDFDWEPKTSLPDGLAKTIRWYIQNPPIETYTHLKNV